MSTVLPLPFQRQMQDLLGSDYPAFEASFQQPSPVSIRLNPAKIPQQAALLPTFSGAVPWHPQGFYLPERPVFTLDPLLHAGAYYVQEASSMFLQEALRQTTDTSKPLKILDLCAAPGGKSTLLQAFAGARGLLVSNEVIRTRVGVLRENLEKWGGLPVAVASAEADVFEALEGWFDMVLIDAPCSGEGLFRKDPEAMREWSPAHVGFCAGRQRSILASAVATLAPGGVLLYSTCTYNCEENEANASWLGRAFGLEPLTLQIPPEWGITASDGGYHFYPHRLRGEGFFLALFRKKDGPAPRQNAPAAFKNIKPLAKNLLPEMARWVADPTALRFFQTSSGNVLALPEDWVNALLLLDKMLKTKWFGIHLGEFKGKDFAPGHALALGEIVNPDLPVADLNRDQALLFLKKETFPLPAGLPLGWTLARYGGLPLGWIKVLPNRMNNYLPPERRIRMQLDGPTRYADGSSV